MISVDTIPFSLPVLLTAGPLLAVFLLLRGMALLQFFQQEEYDGPRFIKWLHHKKAYDRRASLWFGLALLVGSLSQTGLLKMLGSAVWPLILLGLVHGIIASRANLRGSKKKLVLTTRAKRILATYYGLGVLSLALIVTAATFAPAGSEFRVNLNLIDFDLGVIEYDWRVAAFAGLLLLFVQALPFILVAANKLLEPAEERVKARYRQEAISKFNTLKPTVIAITGSFGKTSTKHILAHILSNMAPTLATPGSVNTDMGITRVIRESLKPEHQFFIVEMGAYGPGSIARLCALTPPDISLITAVGPAHYERFKSLEAVARTKFEIAESVFRKGGKAIVNKDGIPPDLFEDRIKNVPGDYLIVGSGGEANITTSAVEASGTRVQLRLEGEIIELKAPLYGTHQAENIAVAAMTAHALGMPWSAIKGALLSVPQIKHRLEVSELPGGPVLINDAYNSNPIGFAAALECLDVLVKPDGRRILITPGMVELGLKHDAEHERLGRLAAHHTDIILVVTPSRIPTFMRGLEAENKGAVTVMTFETQEAAETWAMSNWRAGDAVLFENNLPDIYESDATF